MGIARIFGRADLPREARRVAAIALSCILPGCTLLNAPRLSPSETMMWSTYPLASESSIGACFLVAVKDPRKRGGFTPVVITSTHVLESARKRGILIPLRALDQNGELALFLIRVEGERGGLPPFVSHPYLDVAAFELPLPEALRSRLLLTLLVEENLVTSAARSPRAGESVCFLGYPEGLPATTDLFPILRGGRVASYDPTGSSTQAFLINGDVYPGDSGGPVFRFTKRGTPQLVGMIIRRGGTPREKRMPIALATGTGPIQETLRAFARRNLQPGRAFILRPDRSTRATSQPPRE